MGEQKPKKRLGGKVQFKHETEANWELSNYVPDKGEQVLYDPDEQIKHTRIKFGNGKDKVKDLPFSAEADLTGYATEDYVDEKTYGYNASVDENDFSTGSLELVDLNVNAQANLNVSGEFIKIDGMSVSIGAGSDGINISSQEFLDIKAGIRSSITVSSFPGESAIDMHSGQPCLELYEQTLAGDLGNVAGDNAMARLSIRDMALELKKEFVDNNEEEAALEERKTFSIRGVDSAAINGKEIATEEYVDNAVVKADINIGIEKGEEEHSIQQVTSNAISEGATAFGVNTFAGLKGFTIVSYSPVEKSYTLSSELPEEVSAGVTYSAQIKNNFYNYGKITAISNDRLTIHVDNYIDVDEMQAAAGAGVEIVKNIWFVDYPTAGDIDIGKYAFATGSGSKATQEYTFSTGRDNKSIGKYSSTLGRDNQAYYAAFAAGQNNKSLNERAYTLGNKNTVTGLNAGALGYNNTTSGDNAVALGNSLKATGNDQTVVGKANTEDADAMFIVGTGTYNNKARNNAFVVKKDNTVEANFTPTKNTHITNKKYVDEQVAAVPLPDMTQYYTKVESDDKFVGDADLDNYYTKTEVDEKTAPVYITDAETSYSKQVPANAQGIAKISSISGNSQVCNNLLKYPYTNSTKAANGVTYTDIGDGTINLNGNATGDSTFYLRNYADNYALSAGTYTLSGISGVAGWNTYTLVINAKDSTGATILSSGAITKDGKYTFTLAKDAAQCQIYLKVKSGMNFDNVLVTPMLNAGKEALPFEAWFDGGKAAHVTSIVCKDVDGNSVYITKVPSEIQTLTGYGTNDFSMNLEEQTYTYGDKTNALPANFGPFFNVVPSGTLEFVNADGTKVPSVVTYVTDKEHADIWRGFERIDDSIANIDVPDIDLSDYATKEYVDDLITSNHQVDEYTSIHDKCIQVGDPAPYGDNASLKLNAESGSNYISQAKLSAGLITIEAEQDNSTVNRNRISLVTNSRVWNAPRLVLDVIEYPDGETPDDKIFAISGVNNATINDKEIATQEYVDNLITQLTEQITGLTEQLRLINEGGIE